jgi:hypothetical protein
VVNVRLHPPALVFAVAIASPAHAEVDWAKGRVTGDGLGVADRHAPSPAAAREPARRRAEEAAKKKIAAQLPAIPLAGGGTLEDKLADKAIAARVARVIDAALTVAATPATDGSWNVTLAVPLEALRQAVSSGPRVATKSDADPPILIVERVGVKPALGYTIGGIAASTVWFSEPPEWARKAPRIKVTGIKGADITVATKQGGPSTLFFVLVK